MTVPALSDIISGKVRVSALRHIELDDLLGRDPVELDIPGLQGFLKGRTVLVTGAGGSIGSELCRQIARFQPARVVLFELSELALYGIEREFRETNPGVEVVAAIGDAKDEARMRSLFAQWRPAVVFHAAAYKHVPLVEMNPIAGADNNIFGTLNVVQAAQRHGAEKFVLISTDKAVRPTNVMGAAKRIAERLVQALGKSESKTACAIVRFGNVLDSAGSVVPLFREQIRNGGPVTVTDPAMVRYFMTIPEAADLVIQAGAMAGGDGDLFHLDMGDPVNVADLARKLIHLSGFSVREPGVGGGDIEIRFTGIRPGEKLFEELLVDGASRPTAHPRIFRAGEDAMSWAALEPWLAQLAQIMASQDVGALKAVLRQLVESYGAGQEQNPGIRATGD